MTEETKPKGERPKYRLVQAERNEAGEQTYNNVGGIWVNKSKKGEDYLSIKIGNLRLLGFLNEERKE